MATSIMFYKDQVDIDLFFPFGTSLGAIESFARLIKSYTAAGLSEVSYTQSLQINLPQNDSVEAYPLRNYAKILMRRQADGKLYGCLIYAPVKSMFDTIPSGGWRVKQTIGETISSWYSQLTGETFTFHKGWLTGETYGD